MLRMKWTLYCIMFGVSCMLSSLSVKRLKISPSSINHVIYSDHLSFPAAAVCDWIIKALTQSVTGAFFKNSLNKTERQKVFRTAKCQIRLQA